MNNNYQHIKVIGFDGDDTLWVNETYFRDAELEFAQLMATYDTSIRIDEILYKKEIDNLPLYGYGIKGFVLSMIETAIELSHHKLSNEIIVQILNIGKDMLNAPVDLLDGVENVLKYLSNKYKLIVITKGDLLDQERKLKTSNLSPYFHHIEVLSDKQESNYVRVLERLEVKPSEFLMIGNSLKSDILPVINIGAQAIHIPFHTTWLHEQVTIQETKNSCYESITSLNQLKLVLN